MTCRKKHKDALESATWMRGKSTSVADEFVVPKRSCRAGDEGRQSSEGVASSPTVVPETPRTARAAGVDWTPGFLSDITSASSVEDLCNKPIPGSAVQDFNEAMTKISEHTTGPNFEPLEFQLSTPWDDAAPGDKSVCVERASDACRTICGFIAPNDGEKLLQAIKQASNNGPTQDLIALMSAYRDAQTKNVKLQILSIYAYFHTMKELQAFHEPYERVSLRQIKLARAHSKKRGPGSVVPKIINHRVRLDTNKVDHFVDFINRPYFYQDVAFGTRTLTLDGGKHITMPNVVRTITRSTMIMQYLEHCEEDSFQPISRSTIYRILEVREASQQKSLSGLDNIAAEGVDAFERLYSIIDELREVGADKDTTEALKKRLNDGKKYLKTSYKNNCATEESECPDHCRRFSLSDPSAPELQDQCSHASHPLSCTHCEDLKAALDDIKLCITTHSSQLYNDEQRDDLLHDYEDSKNKIFSWKCHIMRGVNQERAKQDVLSNLDEHTALIVIDWAMKFVQLRYREK